MKAIPMMLAAAVLAAVGTSCSPSKPKNCPPVTSRAIITETDVLRGYLRDKGIAVQEDSLGYFYTIEEAGTGKAPNPCSDVTVDYEGTLANGMPFDAGKNVSFNLSQLILGWQMGIPKIKEGGKIILYLPPSIAYGDRASGDIPPHSNLIFKIALKKVE